VMPPSATPDSSGDSSRSTSFLSEFNQHQQHILTQEDQEGWAAELRCYLKDVPADVTKDTDIMEWWQVCAISFDSTNLSKA